MPSRDRKQWKPDANGVFARQIGYTQAADGRLNQPKFRLGTDSREAKRRADLIRALWDHLEVSSVSKPACWTEDALEAAKQLSRGCSHVTVNRQSAEETHVYAQRISNLRRRMPMVAIVPADEVDYAIGVMKVKATIENMQHVRKTMESMSDLMLEPYREYLNPETQYSGPMFHAALRAHMQWIKQEYRTAATGDPTQWGHVRIKRVQTLIDHHQDFPLAALNLSRIEELYRYWRQRPPRKGTDIPVAKKSASNQVAALKDFLAWLHRATEYEWRRPDDLNMIETRVKTLPEDRRRQVMPDVLYSLEELVLLNKYATPLERLLVLLGLNCAFGRAEIASLLVGEVYLRSPHDAHQQEILAYTMRSEDSFIKRTRRKSGVYGEHILFSQTVQGIEWALAHRNNFPDFGPQARLVLNDNGQPYDKPSSSGNANQQISNRFGDLLNRIQADDNQIRELSFGKLRKTAGDLIRRFSDGETAGIFLCHGQPVKSDNLADVYSSRPFGKVFAAIRRVEEYLMPMFDAAGPEAFKPNPQAYTGLKTVERIMECHRKEMSPHQIAEEVGTSLATVQRHIARVTGPRRRGRPKKSR